MSLPPSPLSKAAPPSNVSPVHPPQSLAPLILRETRAIRSLIEEAIQPESQGDGTDADPIRSLLDVQSMILQALAELQRSVEALHHRLDLQTRPAPAGGQ